MFLERRAGLGNRQPADVTGAVRSNVDLAVRPDELTPYNLAVPPDRDEQLIPLLPDAVGRLDALGLQIRVVGGCRRQGC